MRGSETHECYTSRDSFLRLCSAGTGIGPDHGCKKCEMGNDTFHKLELSIKKTKQDQFAFYDTLIL